MTIRSWTVGQRGRSNFSHSRLRDKDVRAVSLLTVQNVIAQRNVMDFCPHLQDHERRPRRETGSIWRERIRGLGRSLGGETEEGEQYLYRHDWFTLHLQGRRHSFSGPQR